MGGDGAGFEGAVDAGAEAVAESEIAVFLGVGADEAFVPFGVRCESVADVVQAALVALLAGAGFGGHEVTLRNKGGG